jgi:beta-N-acetylhexosaminidase
VRASPGRAALAALLVAATAGCALFRPDPARIAPLVHDAGRLVLAGFHGTAVADHPDVHQLVCEAQVAGLVLFGRNIVDRDQVARLTRDLQASAQACGREPLLIAVDAEGGQVMRLGPAAGYTPTLSAAELGGGGDFTVTELEARRIGAMLREAGIGWNLAPVVDVGYNPANPVIVGVGRAFGANPVLVTNHARAFIRGMRAEGILTAIKHFPGHGSSFADSHYGFADVTWTASPDIELAPYRALIAEGLVDAVMTAHVFNRLLDVWYPATLSPATIEGLLRRDLGWKGPVVSDDLRMGAIVRHYGLADAAVLALRAGVDLLLVADDRLPDGGSATALVLDAVRRALAAGRLAPERVAEALDRVRALEARARPGPPA